MSTAAATAGAPAAPAAPSTFRDVLRIDVMRNVWLAQVISLFGDRIHLIAITLVVVQATHASPLAIAPIFIAATIPNLFLSPVAGTFVDHSCDIREHACYSPTDSYTDAVYYTGDCAHQFDSRFERH